MLRQVALPGTRSRLRETDSMNVDPPLHAWVDESIHAARGLYILAAAIAPADEAQLEEARDALVRQLLRGQRRLHWRDEGKHRRRAAIVGAVAQLKISSVVVVATHIDARTQDERARRKCLERLLGQLTDFGVRQVWIESRGRQDARDLTMVAALRSRGGLPSSMRVDFARPLEEPMLWIPDAVAGAIGAARAGDDRYRTVLMHMLTEHEFEL